MRKFFKFHQILHIVATKLTFSDEFLMDSKIYRPQNHSKSMFRTTLRLFSSHVIKCHACPTICTLSALDAALKMRFPKYARRHVSSAVPVVPATQNDDGGHQSSAPVNAPHLRKTTQKNCTCHALSTRFKTCWNVTKSHAAHAKQSYATIETS